MNSRIVFSFHVFLLISYTALVFVEVSTYILAQKLFIFSSLLLASMPAVVIIGTWHVFGGCMLTQLENYYKEKEIAGSSYQGLFTDQYAKKYLGIRISRIANVSVLTTLLLVPILLALFSSGAI